mmetsp:Transcript_22727/g.64377  ORF Transcript_22727/g.64377 Transcript_22727/m.64377 type:complete len:222 (+) Transcript_22727:1546-2211(+)
MVTWWARLWLETWWVDTCTPWTTSSACNCGSCPERQFRRPGPFRPLGWDRRRRCLPCLRRTLRQCLCHRPLCLPRSPSAPWWISAPWRTWTSWTLPSVPLWTLATLRICRSAPLWTSETLLISRSVPWWTLAILRICQWAPWWTLWIGMFPSWLTWCDGASAAYARHAQNGVPPHRPSTAAAAVAGRCPELEYEREHEHEYQHEKQWYDADSRVPAASEIR